MSHILGFNGIRAFAAIAVVLTHLGFYKFIQENGWLSESFIRSINGSSGVQVFFVLSGFLITSLLIEEKKNSAISLFNFYIRRSLRIFPLYFILLFSVFLFHVVGQNVTNFKSLMFAGVFFYNFIPKAWYSAVLGHTWSLAVEEHFYLLWPFVFITFSKDFKKLSLVLLVCFLLSLIAAMVLKEIELLRSNFFIGRWTFVAGSNIGFGAALALMLKDEKAGPKMHIMLRSKATFVIAAFLVFNQLFLIDVDFYISQYIRCVGFALFIGWVSINQNSLLVRVLEIKPLDYLGRVSYGIYMYQGLLLSTGPDMAS